MKSFLLASFLTVGGAGCGASGAGTFGLSVVHNTSVEVPSGIAAILAQPDRSAADRALDEPRQAAEILAYLDVSPGLNVAVLAPGSGYFLDLAARSVGLNGRIFARNPPLLLAASGLGAAWDARLSQPAGARVIRIDDELGKQLAVQWLDLVFLDHDYAGLRQSAIDPSAVDLVAWNALHPGGRFVVAEREADSAATRAEIERHGFRFSSEARFLHEGVDPTDWGGGGPSGQKSVLLTFTKP
ncbi:MAG: hypothetical protein ACLQVI_20345 [Polyangiaceae bacterium]